MTNKHHPPKINWLPENLPPIFTEQEAAEYLKTDPSTLVNLRRRKELSFVPIGKEARYTVQHLLDFLTRREKVCEESPTSSSFVMQADTSNHHAGTSATMTENEVNASLLGVKLARKTMKPTLRSPHSYSKEKSQPHGSQIN